MAMRPFQALICGIAMALMTVFISGCSMVEEEDESENPSLPVPSVCSAKENFKPDHVFRQFNFPGVCIFADVPGEEVCEPAGCSLISDGKCVCGSEAACAEAGGLWEVHTCSTIVDFLGITQNLSEVEAWNSSCRDIHMTGDDSSLPSKFIAEFANMAGLSPGSPITLDDYVSFLASECCSDAPASICDSSKEAILPCVSEASFRSTSISWEGCVGDRFYPMEQCVRASCDWSNGECRCRDQNSCDNLRGPQWISQDCGTVSLRYSTALRESLEEARQTQVCSYALHEWLTEEARNCCSDYPDTHCQEVSLLAPVSVTQPDTVLFPPKRRERLPPANHLVEGPKHTNKFWGNWVVDNGQGSFSIYPSPYTLRWDEASGALFVMKGETDYQSSDFFTSHWWPDFRIGIAGDFEGTYSVIKEEHFGIHAQQRASGPSGRCTMTVPVYAGMAYVSARFEGGCTPRVDTTWYLESITKVAPGIWQFRKSRSPNDKEYRVYVLTSSGRFVDDSYDFDATTGLLNQELDGWVRLADVQETSDYEVLDASAGTILVGWTFDVLAGEVKYNFETISDDTDKFLHWAYSNHIAFLAGGARVEERLQRTLSPVKGRMWPLIGGNTWTMKMDIEEALAVSFLPAVEPQEGWVQALREEVARDWAWLKTSWRRELHRRDHYFSGKGFQKLATLCHMLAKFQGRDNEDTRDCAAALREGFACMFDRDVSDGSDRDLEDENGDSLQEVGCWWSPFGTWYDEDWGGIPSRWDDAPICGLDFGNSCYNDHHYHWGYYVVGAAMLVDLLPSMKEEPKFVELIEMFIRDVGNPSMEDTYFPQFRNFDWFDMHSWSRGLVPDPDGKDQESTSEEVNFHFGVKLWGDATSNAAMTQLGATMLTASAQALQDYFLMKRDNINHPFEFALNHVTGIFFQNKVHLTTWFGADIKYIHGIQMLPLSAGLPLSRTAAFAWEEWVDRLEPLEVDLTDPWWSILLSGNLAMHNPEAAWEQLSLMESSHMDDGLIKSWALYWTSVQSYYEGHDLYNPNSLLKPVSVEQPDAVLFPPKRRSPLEPANHAVEGPKHTNKFWGNWVVDDNQGALSIYPSPYTLQWDVETGALFVMKGETDYSARPLDFFTSHWWPDFRIGIAGQFEGSYTVTKEDHFGIHVQKQAGACTMTLPIYAGMAYVSARFEGGCTPRVDTAWYLESITKVSPGIWQFRKSQSPNDKEYRVYVLTSSGNLVDDSFDFDATGTLNLELDGWVRLADVQETSDYEALDESAGTILVGWEFGLEAGKVTYNFDTISQDRGKFLHWAYSNHIAFLVDGARVDKGLAMTLSPVKGRMWPVMGGNTWTMEMDIEEALAVSFLPVAEPEAEKVQALRNEVARDWAWFKTSWRMELHKRDHYFSGKGFQKLATLCHMLAKFQGRDNEDTRDCAATLREGYACMYDRSVSDGSDRQLEDENGNSLQGEGCWWSPFGTWYDEDWGGIPSRWDDSPTCGLDFGNSCFNDHHYHWGYYVVGAAMLIDLLPSMKEEPKFVELIEMFIRDVANPSEEDTYFPQFRNFDWFDMHSWSRGLKPDPSGKDQESTSEEVNFHYGVKLWGDVVGNAGMTQLGATMLTASAQALQDYFLMKRDNVNHPFEFTLNHVTGIFFQNKVHLTTWFGADIKYIHGIQMLPLSAGLPLSRTAAFAWEEWVDRLEPLEVDLTDPWWSILLSGNLAMHNPEAAWGQLTQMDASSMDDGLIKSWAMYWTSVQTNYPGHELYDPNEQRSILFPVRVTQPDTVLFPPRARSPLEPVKTEVAGPKHTNKFWGNWVVNDGNEDFSIYPSPYTLRWDEGEGGSGALFVYKSETDYSGATDFFTNHWWPDFRVGIAEQFDGSYSVIKEEHFGIHARKRAGTCTMTLPIYAGMAYVSARYEGGCTPRVDTSWHLESITKVAPGIWQFRKSHSPNNKEFRVYVLTPMGSFVDDSYDFDPETGILNQELDGWVRLADVQGASDYDVLDGSAGTILVGWDFDIEAGKVVYNFDTVSRRTNKFLHWAYDNHVAFLVDGANVEEGLTRTRSPVKGQMWPVIGGETWTMMMDISEALDVSFLPAEANREEWVNSLRSEVAQDWAMMKTSWRTQLHKRDHYFSGKGFQKMAALCHMLAKFQGRDNEDTLNCAAILREAFACMYDRSVSDGSDRQLEDENGNSLQEEGCWWSPFGTWYDEDWGGIPSRWDDSPICGLDFGNSCYNDHHYHWGYYLVSAAMLVDLLPSMKEEPKFVDFIEMFIRDVGNPSKEDRYFPQFRAFDWFDMHSWSRGLKPEPSGKDQESTSEEVNFHYGMKLWGDATGNGNLTQLGATMLVASAEALQDYFLLKRNNTNYPFVFLLNHVTGIFFQNKVHVTTWFGPNREYIHGIQMLPLTAGLLLSRTAAFAWEEWIDQIQHLQIRHDDPWWSILFTGNLAMHDPDAAWGNLTLMDASSMDDGLIKSWALYWTSIQTPYPGHTLYEPGDGGGGGECTTGPCCDPYATNPPQLCPGEIECPQCGFPGCQCPDLPELGSVIV